jgi:hypothetical protein
VAGAGAALALDTATGRNSPCHGAPAAGMLVLPCAISRDRALRALMLALMVLTLTPK